ncbi:hypothetical protein [Mycobacterium alsense]|uniref:hypothetical protein n=1 Tax=Mycobacterium alsense TaxID=324058 RepID=UPI001F6251F7|nr:hypothetical protein [Mycobacterium alsense]
MAAQGLGGALSPVLGGVVAQHSGFPAAFAMLGGLSLGSLFIWLRFRSVLRRVDDTAAPVPAPVGAG